jgi:hypothetical protein
MLTDADFVSVTQREDHDDQYAITDADCDYLLGEYNAGLRCPALGARSLGGIRPDYYAKLG